MLQVGAGIQIPPNSTRLLEGWGLDRYWREHVVEPEEITFRRWKDGSAIAKTKLKPEARIKYQAPYYLAHRAHFHKALHQLALHHGVELKVDHQVVDYDETLPSVTVMNGQTLKADLVIAADGVSSALPPAMCPCTDTAQG